MSSKFGITNYAGREIVKMYLSVSKRLVSIQRIHFFEPLVPIWARALEVFWVTTAQV
jgi:hypothetical protein